MVANVLWTGHESESWQNGSTPIIVTTSSSNYDSNYSRAAAVIFVGALKWGPTSLGGIPQAWLRMRAATYFGVSVNSNTPCIEFRTSGGQGILRLYVGGSPSTIVLQYWNGSAWINIGSPQPTTNAVSNSFIDVVCLIDGTNGWFGWWIDGTKQYELYGVNTDFFSASIDSVYISGWNQFNGSAISEIILADGETLGMRCATLAVNGAGATNTFSSGTYVDVDETTVNDTDMISSNAAGQLATFSLSNLSATAQALTPVAVQVNMRARIGASPPQNVNAEIRVNGTNYSSPALNMPTTSFQNGFGYVWNDSPDTSAPWTVTEINGAEGGAESAT